MDRDDGCAWKRTYVRTHQILHFKYVQFIVDQNPNKGFLKRQSPAQGKWHSWLSGRAAFGCVSPPLEPLTEPLSSAEQVHPGKRRKGAETARAGCGRTELMITVAAPPRLHSTPRGGRSPAPPARRPPARPAPRSPAPPPPAARPRPRCARTW